MEVISLDRTSSELSLVPEAPGSSAPTRRLLSRAANQGDVLEVLRLITPRKVVGFSKVRIGCTGDGGYVMLDDFADVIGGLSFGIGGNDDWDLALADRGISVNQFDHTINAAPTRHNLLHFHKKMIGPQASDGAVTLPDLVKDYPASEHANIILKMDIEGDEWDVFEATAESALGRLSQIVCEFHDLHRLAEPDFRAKAKRVFSALNNTHAVIHVHANNFDFLYSVANIAIPGTLEIGFVARSRYSFTASDELFPASLNSPNDGIGPDIYWFIPVLKRTASGRRKTGAAWLRRRLFRVFAVGRAYYCPTYSPI